MIELIQEQVRERFVADERSGQSTDRGQSRNIEVGVRIRDPHFAKQLEQQWNNLVVSKDVLPG